MDDLETIVAVGFVVLLLALAGSGPPRFRRVRGAPMWTDRSDAQWCHLDHYTRPGTARADGEDD